MEGQRIARLLVIAQGMSQQLVAMLKDESVPCAHHRAIKDLLRLWAADGGKVVLPKPEPVMMVLDGLCEEPDSAVKSPKCPAILPLSERVVNTSKIRFRGQVTPEIRARVSRLRSYLEERGPTGMAEIAADLGLEKAQVKYALRQGGFEVFGGRWSVARLTGS